MNKILTSFLVFLIVATTVFSAEKLTDRSELTSPTSDDLVYVVDDPLGTPASYNSTLDNMSKGLNASNIPNTPAGSIEDTTIQGAINELDTDKCKSYIGTGILDGGDLSINVDTTKFDILLGNGCVVNNTDPNIPVITEVPWITQTAITVDNIATQLVTYISIDSAGTIIQRGTILTPEQRRDEIQIGLLVHTNLTNIEKVVNFGSYGFDLAGKINDLGYALGTSINIEGSDYSANGANLRVDRSTGMIYEDGQNRTMNVKTPNISTVAGDTEVFLILASATVTTGVSQDIDVTQYDPDGTGTLQPIPDGCFVAHRIFFTADLGLNIMQYGQHCYDSLKKSAETSSKEEFIPNPQLVNTPLRTILSVVKNATAFNNRTQAKFSNLGLFGSKTFERIPSFSLFAENIEIASALSYQRQDITFLEDTGSLYADIEAVGGGDITYIFNQQEYTLDCTTGAGVGGKARILLTAGTDTAPQKNWIYITKTTGMSADINSSTSEPTGEYAMIGTVLLPSITTFNSRGSYGSRRWTDTKELDGRGAIATIFEVLREYFLRYKSGLLTVLTIDTVPSPDNLDFTTDAGVIKQIYKQTTDALQLSVDGALVVNDETNPYTEITNLNQITTDTTGATLQSNNTYYQLVLAISTNIDGKTQLLINKPNGSYSTAQEAFNDTSGYSVTSFPSKFETVALVAAFVLQYQTTGGGTYINAALPFGLNNIDLRGKAAGSTSSGSGTSAIQEFSTALFRLFDPILATKEASFDVSSLTGTKTFSYQDITGTIAMLANKLSDFASTTSAELASVLSNETGTGLVVFNDTPTIENINANNTKITGLAEPTLGTDGATKNYIDTKLDRLSWRPPVNLLDDVQTDVGANVIGQTSYIIDGQAIINNDRVLFTAETTMPATYDERVFLVGGVGSSITLTLETDGQAGNGNPTDSDVVFVAFGTNNGDKLFVYNGTTFILGSSLNGALKANSNLLDLTNTTTARDNLGLGTSDNVTFNQITGIIQTALQPNITEIGSITTGTTKLRILSGADLTRDSQSIGNGVAFNLKMKNDASEETIYSSMFSFIEDNANGTEDGSFVISNISDGSAIYPFKVNELGQTIIGSDALTELSDNRLQVKGSVDLQTDNTYKIGNTTVISNNALGTGIFNSNLTGVGELTSGSLGTGFGNISIGSSQIVAGKMIINGPSATGGMAIIGGTGTAGTYIDLVEQGTKAWSIGIDDASSTLRIRENNYAGTTAMSILNGGNVGIGTDSPDHKTHIYKTGSSVQLSLERGLSGQYDLGADSEGLKFWAGGFNADPVVDIIFDQSGKVGIGTSSPNTKLTITDTLGKTLTSPINWGLQVKDITTGGGAGVGGSIVFTGLRSDGGTFNSGAISGVKSNSTGLNEDSDLAFYASNAGTLFEAMRIDSSGNVGIGTTTPATSAKLEISSTTGALLLPRMTTTQRNALTAVNGMMIYNNTTNQFEGYENGAWVDL